MIDDSPAARAKLVDPAGGKVAKDDAKFKNGDEIVRVGDTPVKNYREFSAELAQHTEENLRVTVRRQTAESDVKSNGDAAVKEQSSQELTFEVPHAAAAPTSTSIMKIGPITSIRNDSPAAKAGLAAGDVIEKVDGKQLGEGANPLESWTAATLPDYLRRAAKEGREVEITVAATKGCWPD